MKKLAGLAAALLLVSSALPVSAADRSVSSETLAQLGLGQMRVLSDAEGMQIRGLATEAFSASSSGFSLFFQDPSSASFFQFQGANFGTGSEDNGGNQEQAGSDSGSLTQFSGLPTTTINTGGNTMTITVGAMVFGGFGNAAGN